MIEERLIRLNESIDSKYDAIELAGKLLFDNGYVVEDYVKSMHERDKKLSVFMGNMIAIPHATDEGRLGVIKTGISIVQVPSGVDFDGNEVKLVFGIAANEDEHMDVISNIAILCSDEENVCELVKIDNTTAMLEIIKRGEI